jgi:DNA-binding GntR family transcriptional regulator
VGRKYEMVAGDVQDPPTPDGGAEATTEGRRAYTAVQNVHSQLREAIIRGDLRPGEAVTSVEVAERFGVSRTPAREALRMLQEEGFLRGDRGHRLRIVEWSAEELESVFAQRILLSVLSTRLTIPTLKEQDLSRMEALMSRMANAREAGEHEAWRVADIEFHQIHMQGASETLLSDIRRLYERASMFRAIWLRSRDHSLSYSLNDHPLILERCRAGDADGGGAAAALHLTRVALSLMTELAPDREPAAIRQAFRLAGGMSEAVGPTNKRPR